MIEIARYARRSAGLLAAAGLALGIAFALPGNAAAALGTANPGELIESDVSADTVEQCTLGITGHLGATQYGVTAGHCLRPAARVRDGAGNTIGWAESVVNDDLNTNTFGYGLVRLYPGVRVSDSLGDLRIGSIDDNPTVGSRACKLGSRTGSSCGTIAAVGGNTIRIDGMYSDQGDSGGAVFYNTGDNQVAFLGIIIGNNAAREYVVAEKANYLYRQIAQYAAQFTFYAG